MEQKYLHSFIAKRGESFFQNFVYFVLILIAMFRFCRFLQHICTSGLHATSCNRTML